MLGGKSIFGKFLRPNSIHVISQKNRIFWISEKNHSISFFQAKMMWQANKRDEAKHGALFENGTEAASYQTRKIQEKPVPNKKNAKKGSKEESIKEVLRRRGRRSKRRGNDEVATRIINILDRCSLINLN